MAWNFNPAELETVELYQVRLEIGDTDPLDPQLQDESIVWAASQERDFWCACARCLEIIARVKLRKADVSLGRQLSITYSKMAQQLMEQAQALRRKSLGSIPPWVGGMNVSDQLAYMQNTDLIQPNFTKTMMENPRVGGYTTDSLWPIEGGGTSEGDEFDF